MSKRTDLAGILNDRHRHVIWAVVEDVTASPPEDSIALQLMRVTDVPAAILEHEIVAGSGGKTQERVMGAPGKSVPGPSSTPKIFEPGSYQEFTKFTEKDLLKLRKLGSLGERGVTGLSAGELDWMERVAKKHKRRLINRLAQLAWDALFTGQYVYQGIAYSFGIPGANTIMSATDWTVSGSGFDPFKDLIAILGQNSYLRKYRKLIKAFILNPTSEADILQRALENKSYIINNNMTSLGINEIRKIAAPGLPPFEVCDDAMQDETVNPDGSVSLGTAYFLIPDHKLLVVMDFNKGEVLFPEYGQIQLTENMNDPSATIEKPAVGVYSFIDDKGLEHRDAPWVKLITGFNGGANLMRPNDVFVIQYH